MKKSTKGALAAAAAGSLLLGGTGSLAYWTATGSVTGGSISSGNLTMSAPNCTTGGNHDWQYANNDPFSVGGGSKVVPGDTISKVCTFTITAAGDHIAATVAATGGEITNDASGTTTLDTELVPTVSALDVREGGQPATIDHAGTFTVQATVSVAFDGTNATNGSKDLSAALSNVTITATQS